MSAPRDAELTGTVRSVLRDIAERLARPLAELPGAIESPALADLLGHGTTRTLDSWTSSGRGPVYTKRGRHRVYLLSDVVGWLVGQRRGGSSFADADVARVVAEEIGALTAKTEEAA